MTLDREELAWAAGFFDGEGHVRFASSGKGPYITLEIKQVAADPLHRFQRAIGAGRVNGPYSSTGNKRPYWVYWASSWSDVQIVVALLWKWMGIIKKAQAASALSRRIAYGKVHSGQ